MKSWKDFDDECPRCGDTSEVYTSAKGDYVYEDDHAQCKSCGLEGSVIINDEGSFELNRAYVNWNNHDED